MNISKNLFLGFTTKYNITRLVYYEATDDIGAAIEREKQIKGWLRRKKIALIDAVNPEWRDLSVDWSCEHSCPREDSLSLPVTGCLEILRFRSG
jgi:hypothetical protein